MARRKKPSSAAEMVGLVSLLPWYVAVGAAIASYVALHMVATSTAPSITGQKDLSGAMVGAVLRGFATVGQYFVPAICLVAAAVSAWRRHHRDALIEGTTASHGTDSLEGVSWQEFEMLVGEGFRRQGYSVTENSGPGPDGGVDLTLRKGGEKYLVQCKQWRAFKVGVPIVRELYGVMAARGAAGGFVVTSGLFTAEAQQFAQGRNITLLDGPALHRLLAQGRHGASRVDAETGPYAKPAPIGTPMSVSSANPDCPKCAKPMVRRMAKVGVNAGKEFWGCTGYPRCRETV